MHEDKSASNLELFDWQTNVRNSLVSIACYGSNKGDNGGQALLLLAIQYSPGRERLLLPKCFDKVAHFCNFAGW